MEILIKYKGKIIKYCYTDKEIYNKMLLKFQEWDKEGKIEIIPQDINNFIKTGIKI